jgi:hypothetical protein
MPRHAVLDAHLSNHISCQTLEAAILDHVDAEAVIGLDALVMGLPEYSWSQIFHAVDRLTRQGQVTLRRHRSEYTLFSSDYTA